MNKNNKNVPYKALNYQTNHNIGHPPINPHTQFNPSEQRPNKSNNFNSFNRPNNFNNANNFYGTNNFGGSNGLNNSNSSNNSNGSNGLNNNEKIKENYQNKFRETNQELIKYIYSTIDVSQFKYDLLRYEHQLNKFLTDTYYVSPNFYGKNCFLVFTKIKTKYYSFLIDRRQLSYSFDKVQYDNVYIHHCNVDIDLSIYAGTIFDGVYIKKDNTFEFIITDVYCFKGADYTGTKLRHKLFEIEVYLDNVGSQIKKERFNMNNRTNLELKINKLYDVTNIRQFMENDFKLYQENYQIRGTCFYPETSGTKLIYLFENNEMINVPMLPNIPNKKNDKSSDSDETSLSQPSQPSQPSLQSLHSQHLQSQNQQLSRSYPRSQPQSQSQSQSQSQLQSQAQMIKRPLQSSLMYNENETLKKSQRPVKNVLVAKTNEPFYAILGMRSTKIADNYKLFAVERIKNGDVLKKHPMDIAYIPDINKSNWCRKIMTDSQKDVVFVKCVWRHDKGKWEPLELKDVKIPSLMEDIREHLHVLEESDSESDDE